MEHKMCLAICFVSHQTTLWQGVYFCTNSVKVGAVCLTHCCIYILVVVIIIDFVFIKMLLTLLKGLQKLGPKNYGLLFMWLVYIDFIFMKTLLILLKRAIKIEPQNSGLLTTTVVQTARNQIWKEYSNRSCSS